MRLKLSIITKLSLLVTAAVALTAIAVNEVYVKGSSQILINRALSDIEQETEFFRYPLENKISQITEDIAFLGELHATEGLMRATLSGGYDAEDRSTKAQWENRLADTFIEMLETTPHYRSIAFIGIADNHKELMRVERIGDQIVEIPADKLAPHNDDTHIDELFHLAPGKLYLSTPALERKNTTISVPHTLLMHAAIAIYTKDQKLFGIVLIDADFGLALDDIARQMDSERTVYITDGEGAYLLHPDVSRRYAGDLGLEYRLQRDYPSLLSTPIDPETGVAIVMPDDLEKGMVLAYRQYAYAPDHAKKYFGIGIAAPYSEIVQDVVEVERRGFLFSLGVTVIAVFSAMTLLRILIRPLGRIAENVVRYRKGEKNIDLPVESPDEIGTLAREFHTMMRQKDDEDWVKENLVIIVKNLLGFKNLQSFAAALMGAATPAVSAQLGVFYVSGAYGEETYDSHTLHLLGSYGYKNQQNVPEYFALGEGLVGQCAESRKAMLISNIPVNYLRITSGLGEARPRQILLLPVLFEERLVGVMEFATLDGFSHIHRTFLEQLSFNVGVIASGISASMRTEELLEEARMTAEELQKSEEELKVQQEELQASNEELEEKTKALEEQNTQITRQSEEIGESSRIIEEKMEELARANTYKSEFLANMSHELRTPLNSLLILARALASNEQGNLTEEQVEEAAIIHSGGLELLSLINDILDLSKVEAGKINIISEDIPLKGVVERMEKQFSPVALQSGVQFKTNLPKDAPLTLYTDGQRVEQILKNLLSNAFKFTSKGWVELAVHYTSNSAREPMLAFAVTDTGIGIDEAKLKDIFEAFQQEDGSTDRHYGGTGLGLTIARKFAHMLGGEIHVTSRKGNGSTFTLLLPLARSQPQNVNDPLATTLPAPRRSPADDRNRLGTKDKVLLIIEDDQQFCDSLAKIARKRGYKCLLAHDGKSGLLMAAEHPVTAIILDLKLPDMHGLRVLEQLKHDLKTRHIPVHIITAYDDESNALPLRQGAAGYLTKPLKNEDINSIFTRIEDILKTKVKKILVVEDDKKTQTAIRSLLKKSDIDIMLSANGSTALENLRNDSFDCVILDLKLPDMTGLEWLKQMEAQGKEMPPVIIYTAKELSEDEHRLLNAYTGSIVIKGASSSERLLDEVTLFLHSVESTLSRDQQAIIRMQHDPDKMLHGRTVLLVDDDLRNTFALSKVLKQHGLNVVIADNGQMALDKLASESAIELVIMDIMMPVMDGYQAIREIRAQAAHSALPVIALTARAMPEEQEKCMAAGANDYLTKPVDVERLLALLRVWLFRQEKAA